jgi:AcrR family transcriptional regulator
MGRVKGGPERPMTRRERAAATRRSILHAARRLFSERGYAGTSMEAIAREAGVAVQTVYFVFNTKARMILEMIKSIGAGPGEPIATMDRPWAQEALAGTDGRRTLALVAEHGTEIYRRTAPLYSTIVAAASTDPDVADAHRTVLQMKRAGIRRQVEVMARLGHLRPDLSVERATDLIYAIGSIEMYRLLVGDCGWGEDDLKVWVYRTLGRELLREDFADDLAAPHILEGISFARSLRAATQGEGAR